MSATSVKIYATTTNATSVQNTQHVASHIHHAFNAGADTCELQDMALVNNMVLRVPGITHTVTREQFNELLRTIVTKDKNGKGQIAYPQVNGRMTSFRKNHANLGGVSFGKWVRANTPNGDNWADNDISKEMATYTLHLGVASATPTPAVAPADYTSVEALLASIGEIVDTPTPTPTPAPSLESWTVKAGDEVRQYELPSEPVAVAPEATLVAMKAFLTTGGFLTVAQVDRLASDKIEKLYNAMN